MRLAYSDHTTQQSTPIYLKLMVTRREQPGIAYDHCYPLLTTASVASCCYFSVLVFAIELERT